MYVCKIVYSPSRSVNKKQGLQLCSTHKQNPISCPWRRTTASGLWDLEAFLTEMLPARSHYCCILPSETWRTSAPLRSRQRI